MYWLVISVNISNNEHIFYTELFLLKKVQTEFNSNSKYFLMVVKIFLNIQNGHLKSKMAYFVLFFSSKQV